MKNFTIIFSILLFVWFALNNSFQPDIIISGIVISLIITIIGCHQCHVFDEIKFTPKAISYSIIYLFVFLYQLLKSNWDITRRVYSPVLSINPGIVKVETKLKSKLGRLMLANSITLTPGTLTVDIEGESLFIHWIDVETEDVKGASEKIVRTFEKYLEVIYG